MHVDPKTSAIQLEEGEIFVEERQDDQNVYRISTLLLPTGAKVTVERHFSQIGPNVFQPDGKKIDTHLDRETGAVVPIRGVNLEEKFGFKKED